MHLAGIFHNLYLKVQERESVFYKDDKGWRFYVHDPSETPTIGVQTHGTSLYPGQGRDLRLDLKKVPLRSESKDGRIEKEALVDSFSGMDEVSPFRQSL